MCVWSYICIYVTVGVSSEFNIDNAQLLRLDKVVVWGKNVLYKNVFNPFVGLGPVKGIYHAM